MLIIADDITGAAEIAGIAFSHGQRVRLLCGCPGSDASISDGSVSGVSVPDGSVCSCATATPETTVIATDTRSMSEAEAMAETRRLISHFSFLISHF